MTQSQPFNVACFAGWCNPMPTNDPTPPELPRLNSMEIDDILAFQKQAYALWEQEQAQIRLTLPRRKPTGQRRDDDED